MAGLNEHIVEKMIEPVLVPFQINAALSNTLKALVFKISTADQPEVEDPQDQEEPLPASLPRDTP